MLGLHSYEKLPVDVMDPPRMEGSCQGPFDAFVMAEILPGQIQLDMGACFQAVWRRCWDASCPATAQQTQLTSCISSCPYLRSPVPLSHR